MDKITDKEVEKLINGWRKILNDKNYSTMERLKASELLVTALGGFPNEKEITIYIKEVKDNGK